MNGPVIRCQVSFRGRRQNAAAQATEPEATTAKPTGPTTLARRLALAHLLERLIDEDKLRDYADAARRLGITRARMSQIADLALLPIDVQERVLVSQNAVTERTLRKVRSDHLDPDGAEPLPRN